MAPVHIQQPVDIPGMVGPFLLTLDQKRSLSGRRVGMEGIIAPEVNVDERYEASRRAQKEGGPCPVCGWREGDGVKECFYSPKLGAVSHSNQYPEFSMTPQQAALYKLRQEPVYLYEDAREQAIGEVIALRAARGNFSPDHDEEEWIKKYTEEERRKKLVADFPGWIVTPWVNKYMMYVYEPHPGCGGRQIYRGPYHYACSGCDVEVKLWEHGVDYDIG